MIELYAGDRWPDSVDGLLLAGGGDVDPVRYGEDNHGSTNIDVGRDALEFDAFERATELGLPVLGICRGFQVLNVALGGKLVQDVPGHETPVGADHVVNEHRDVRPRPGSRLAAATGGAPLSVNSRHHQAVTVDVLGNGLTATASVGDLVEAFESPADDRWLVGVQWHPERTHEVSKEATAIIDAFVAEAAKR